MRPLSAPLYLPGALGGRPPSVRHWSPKARFHYSDFLETNARRFELVELQIPLQRLLRDKLYLPGALGGRRQTRDVSSLTRV
jgi:hypothetical protein